MIAMKEIYRKWYEQVIKELEVMNGIRWRKLGKTPRAILISGMGGSGIVGDYVQTLASKRVEVPIFVVKDYKIPMWVSSDDLTIVISYSGNTRETIRCYREALKARAQVVVITSNGLLKEYAKKDNIPLIPVIQGLVPRASLPSMLIACLYVLEKFGLPVVSRDEIHESIHVLKEIHENELLSIADKIIGKIPVIITVTDYSPLAWRFKNELNENSKMPAKVEIIPEWAHNDIVGWEAPYNIEKYIVLMLKPRIPTDELSLQMLNYAKKYFEKQGLNVIGIEIAGKSLLAQLLYGSLIAGLISVIVAEKRGISPITTESINEYKNYIVKYFTI